MPFGCITVPELFQKLINTYFDDIQEIVLHFDDLLVYAESEVEHDNILKRVVERARILQIKFNEQKLQYELNEVKYVGFLFNENGIKPDDKRIEPVKKLNESKSKKELQMILGLVNFIR